MLLPRGCDLIGKAVYSGIGEEIGTVVHVEVSPAGFAERLWIVEAGSPDRLREVDARFVREVRAGRVVLKGPREGFHITRLSAPAAAAAAPPAAAALAADERGFRLGPAMGVTES